MKPRTLILVAVLVVTILALPIAYHFDGWANETAKKTVVGKAELAYHITIFKVPITVVANQLAVNREKRLDGKAIVKTTVNKKERILDIQLNKKGVLSVDDGKDILLVYASKKPLPVPAGKKIKIDGRKTFFVGQWLEFGRSKTRKIAFQTKKGDWSIQISQMQGWTKELSRTNVSEKTLPAILPIMFRQAVSSYR